MNAFSVTTRAEAVVSASPEQVWAVLVDPDLMSRLTPFLDSITADGEHWRWQLGGLSVLGRALAPAFTERMELSEPERIDFHHDPPAGTTEQAGVEGWYVLTPEAGGTRLETELEITVRLPLPAAAGGAVRASMRRVVDTMGDRFSQRLLEHLGAEERAAGDR